MYKEGGALRVLIACEYSGRVRESFRKFGHDAWSCDLLPADDGSPYHIQGDVSEYLNGEWDLLVGFPPCTYVCSSGLHWNKRTPGRAEKTEDALKFVQALMDADIPMIAIENPVGCISTRITKASQYIQPYDFGDDASKKTGLWLKGLPLLTPTKRIEPRIVNGKKRWANQTDSGQNRLGPSEDRWKKRSQTYQGIADAMAEQWTNEAKHQTITEEDMTTNTEDTPRKKRKMGISASSYTQLMSCERKWYIGYILKPDVPKTPALQMGIDVHDWLERYLKGEDPPDISEKLVNIAKSGLEHLPEPGTVNVEEWVEDVCGPLPFRGKVDFYTYKEGVLHISDHKTTGRSAYAKTEQELSVSPQMLAYAYVLARKVGEQPKVVKFTHIYYLTKSKVPTSFVVNAEASWSDVEKNWKDFERAAKVMSRLAKIKRQEAITPDMSQCRFCWYKDHCTAYEKPNKKTKVESPFKTDNKTKKKGATMDILKKIKEQKAKQAAAKAEVEKLEAQVTEPSPVVEVAHPTSPEEDIDWTALGKVLLSKIANTEVFTEKALKTFLEYHLGRDIQAEDGSALMGACKNRLRLDKGVVVLETEDAPVLSTQGEKEVQPTPGLSDLLIVLAESEDAAWKEDRLPEQWVATAKPFIRKLLLLLGSSEVLSDLTVRGIAKDLGGCKRLPRKTTIDHLIRFANRREIPLTADSEGCVRLGASDHEQDMADKLGAQLPPEPEPKKVEEPKTHLKPVGKIVEDVVVTTTPVVEEPKSLTPVVVYINAFPSDHIPTKLSDVLAPLQDEVAEEKGVLYYGLVSYNQGPKLVASKLLSLLRECHASEVLGESCFASQKDPCLAEVLPLLERRDDIVIVRGFIG